MLYFAVGIHPLIEKLSGKIKSLNPEHNFLQSYADDISLCIKRENLAEAWSQIADVFPIDGGESGVTANPDTPYEAIGLAVNPLKCFALVAVSRRIEKRVYYIRENRLRVNKPTNYRTKL